MKKKYYYIILFLITLNTVLLYLDTEDTSNSRNPDFTYKKSADSITCQDDFEKIDNALIDRNFQKKWIRTRKTDSLWYKYIKAPNSVGTARYNLFFQKILRENGIKLIKVTEYELSRKLIFNIIANDSIEAKIELAMIKDIEGEISLNGSLAVIIIGTGNNWGPQYIKDLIEFPKPLTFAVRPGYWATEKISIEAVANGKEVIIDMPVEPDVGNIDKDKIKILKGMNYFTIGQMLERAVAELPGVKGIINFKGNKVLSDFETAENFFKNIRKKNMYYIEYISDGESYSGLLCDEYSLSNGLINYYFKESEEFRNKFNDVMEEIHNGDDVTILLECNEGNEKYLQEVILNYTDINLVNVSKLVSSE